MAIDFKKQDKELYQIGREIPTKPVVSALFVGKLGDAQMSVGPKIPTKPADSVLFVGKLGDEHPLRRS